MDSLKDTTFPELTWEPLYGGFKTLAMHGSYDGCAPWQGFRCTAQAWL